MWHPHTHMHHTLFTPFPVSTTAAFLPSLVIPEVAAPHFLHMFKPPKSKSISSQVCPLFSTWTMSLKDVHVRFLLLTGIVAIQIRLQSTAISSSPVITKVGTIKRNTHWRTLCKLGRVLSWMEKVLIGHCIERSYFWTSHWKIPRSSRLFSY